MPHMKPAWSSHHLLIRCISRPRQLVSRLFISRVRAKLEGTLGELASPTHPPTKPASRLAAQNHRLNGFGELKEKVV